MATLPADARAPDRQQARPAARGGSLAMRHEPSRATERSASRQARGDRGNARADRGVALRGGRETGLRGGLARSGRDNFARSGRDSFARSGRDSYGRSGRESFARAGRDYAGRANFGRGGYQVTSLRGGRGVAGRGGQGYASLAGASFASDSSRAYRGGYESFSGISCVPYARSVTGMSISGNGRDWWYNAAGLYDRGHRPEVGSVMAMPGSGAMRMGHVAVVERVIGAREIEIHHANWGGPGIRRGSVMRGVNVVDVSAANDWSAVRVQVGHDDATFGRVYPVYGFIYNRPDRSAGGLLASNGRRGGVELVAGAESATLSQFRGREVAQARPYRR